MFAQSVELKVDFFQLFSELLETVDDKERNFQICMEAVAEAGSTIEGVEEVVVEASCLELGTEAVLEAEAVFHEDFWVALQLHQLHDVLVAG